jgi:protein-disulfide isomerase
MLGMRISALGALLLVPFAVESASVRSEIGLGNNTAPITMEVYSDFQCPHCKQFHDDILPSVIRDYVSTGKLYLIHRDFPLPSFKYSKEAALYAIAASRFNKYEQVGDALFQRQAYWAQNGKVDEVVASVLTPDEMKKARVLIKDPQVNQELAHQVDLGHVAKVDSTPTIFLTHRLRIIKVPPNVSYPILKRVLDDFLK